MAPGGQMAAADGVNGNNPRNTSTNLGPEVRAELTEHTGAVY